MPDKDARALIDAMEEIGLWQNTAVGGLAEIIAKAATRMPGQN